MGAQGEPFCKALINIMSALKVLVSSLGSANRLLERYYRKWRLGSNIDVIKGEEALQHPGELNFPLDRTAIPVWQSLFMLLQCPLFLLDESGQILEANPAAERLWAVPTEELQGQPATGVLGLYRIHDEALTQWSSWSALIAALGEGERVASQLTSRDGQSYWIQIVGSSFTHQSQTYWLIIVVHHRAVATLPEPPTWAWRDPVTGLGNRAYWEHWHQTAPSGGVVILSDLDGLKRINDQYGHAAGDQTLQLVGEILQAALPPLAMAIRYGGDEFLIYQPDADRAWATMWMASVNKTLHQRAEHWPWTPNLSYGAALSAPGDIASAIRAADDALYEQKGTLLRSASGSRLVIQSSQPVGLMGGSADELEAPLDQWASYFGTEFARIMRRQYARWAQEAQAFVQWMNPQPGIAAIEVGAGIGRLAFDGGIAARIGPDGVLILTDPSVAQLHQARRRAMQQQYDWLRFLIAPAEQLPFASGGADLVMGAWFLHLCDARQALRELARVTRPGGQVVVNVLLDFPWTADWMLIWEPIIDALARVGQPFRHMFAAAGAIAQLGEQLGLVVVEREHRSVGTMDFPDPEQAFTFFEQGGHLALLLRHVPPTLHPEVTAMVHQRFLEVLPTMSPTERGLATHAEYVRFRRRAEPTHQLF